MTTSTNADNERSIDELFDLPYSDMTEEEIERIVQYKADIQTRDALYNEALQRMNETLLDIKAQNQEIADNAMNTLNTLTAQAMQRFEDASQ